MAMGMSIGTGYQEPQSINGRGVLTSRMQSITSRLRAVADNARGTVYKIEDQPPAAEKGSSAGGAAPEPWSLERYISACEYALTELETTTLKMEEFFG